MNTYSIGKFADEIGVTVESVRNWDRTGKLKPAFRNPSGHRYYTQEQIDLYLGLHKPDNASTKLVVGYCRVPSPAQNDELACQVERMKAYLASQGHPYKIITDIGSGIDYNKKGLDELIELVLAHKVEKVVVLTKDRLLEFGYELLAKVFSKLDVGIEIIDHSEKTKNEALVDELNRIITVFSARLQGENADKAREMVSALTSDDVNDERYV